MGPLLFLSFIIVVIGSISSSSVRPTESTDSSDSEFSTKSPKTTSFHFGAIHNSPTISGGQPSTCLRVGNGSSHAEAFFFGNRLFFSVKGDVTVQLIRGGKAREYQYLTRIEPMEGDLIFMVTLNLGDWERIGVRPNQILKKDTQASFLESVEELKDAINNPAVSFSVGWVLKRPNPCANDDALEGWMEGED